MVVDADAGRVGRQGMECVGDRLGVGAPIVRRECGEVGGAAGRQDAGVTQRLVIRSDADLAEAAGEVDIRLIDLVAGCLALQLDAGADRQAVIQGGVPGEEDFGVAEETVGVVIVARLAFAIVVEGGHVGAAEEAAEAELDTVSRHGGVGHHPGTEQGGAS
jgi:hypothetical protein